MAKKTKNKVVRRKKFTKHQKVKKQEKEKKSWTWGRFIFFVVVVIFIGGVGYIFFFSHLTRINTININGVNRVPEYKITESVQKNIAGYLTNYIARDNYFFVNTQAIKQDILLDKRVKSVAIKKEFPQSIIVDIVEYDVIPVWCIGSIEGECFTVEDGKINMSVTRDSDILVQNNHFIVVDEGRDYVEIGERIIKKEYIDTIAFLGEELKYALSVGIVQPYFVLSRGSYEARFKTDEDWYILVDITQNPNDIINVAKLFFKKVDLLSRRSDLEYLDMRFPEKIFYKMKDDVEKIEENVEEKEKTEKGV